MNFDLLILTPTLGTRKSICRTIESVINLGLMCRVLHVIIGPIESISWIKQKYPKIILFPEEKSGGVYTALNQVLQSEYSKIEYFGYINDDDTLLPDYKMLLDTLCRSKLLDFCYGRTIFVKNTKFVFKGSFFPFYGVYARLLDANIPIFTQQSLIVKTKWIKKCGYFDEEIPLSADSKMWSSMIQNGAKGKGMNIFCSTYELDGPRLSLDAKLIEREEVLKNSFFRPSFKMSTLLDHFIQISLLFIYRAWNISTYLKRMLYRCGLLKFNL